jgi:CRISPR-associated protein Cmr6
MKRPLYQFKGEPRFDPACSHTGLWFDKFCNQWCRDPQKQGLEAWSLKSCSVPKGRTREDVNPKSDWINTVTQPMVGDAKLIIELSKRLADLARALRGQSTIFTTISRFATGLGREHPIENGFAWHPSLGVPYLPGSSVKGLVRAYAATWCEPHPDTQIYDRLFGPRDAAGSVIFFDALPVAPVRLSADVMTPHYSDYYEGKQDKAGKPAAPGDWLSPNPIFFLTVAVSQNFQFTLAPRTTADQDKQDCNLAVKWLEAALIWLGAGAKTAVGYGRFSAPDVATTSAASTISPPQSKKVPVHKIGNRVTVARIPDPKGKGRIWFRADDGFSGVVTAGASPSVEIGQTVELEIASVIAGQGYNFRLPSTSPPSAKPHFDKRTTQR